MATSLNSFFGGHEGASLYVNASDAVRERRPDVSNSVFEQLMRAENYADFATVESVNNPGDRKSVV